MESIRFDGQVAIVTGAGQGLGRHYALDLAARGARVVVNGRGSNGGANEAAVVDEIRDAGGEAMAICASVTDRAAVTAMVAETLAAWGRVDILVNNAGFVRDSSFAKLDLDDFSAVMDVHVNGAVNCTKAVWDSMLAQGYGRVVFIISSSGLAGNFGQASYGAAKMALVGLMNSVGLEGARKGIHLNCFSPVGITRMNKHLFPEAIQAAYAPELAVGGISFLASREAPNRVILMGGGGSYERAYVTFTQGAQTGPLAEDLAGQFDAVSDRSGEVLPHDANTQAEIELKNIGVKLP